MIHALSTQVFIRSLSPLETIKGGKDCKTKRMSTINDEHIDRLLTELKSGTLLTKRKHNGEKYSRHFFLDNQGDFISYRESEKVFAQSRRCKYGSNIFS